MLMLLLLLLNLLIDGWQLKDCFIDLSFEQTKDHFVSYSVVVNQVLLIFIGGE
jgi:hypothetical protein